MKAKSIHAKNSTELQLVLESSMSNNFRPTLAIVFISIKQDRHEVARLLNEKGIDFIGATSSGEFIDGHQSSGEIVMMLLDIHRSHYTILFSDTHKTNLDDASGEAAHKSLSRFNNPAFILCSTCFSKDGTMLDAAGLMHRLGKAVGKEKPIFGGAAGDDATFTGTWVFTEQRETDHGFVLLVIDHDKIDVQGRAISGWKPLGKVRTVTESKGEWLYGLDGQPALELYLRGLGQKLGDGANADKEFVEKIGVYHPFMALDAGDPQLRTPIAVDAEKNAIRLDFPIAEGKHLQFTLPPDFDIVETVLENASLIRNEKNTNADALLIFSCFGRLSALGPMTEEENEGLQKIWKAPMAGFYSYGEFGKDGRGDHEFHSTTCSWVALREK